MFLTSIPVDPYGNLALISDPWISASLLLLPSLPTPVEIRCKTVVPSVSDQLLTVVDRQDMSLQKTLS